MTELLLQGKEFGPVMFLICLFIGACYKLIKNHEIRTDKKDTEHKEYIDGIAKAYEERLERKDSLHRDERKEWREDIGKSLDKLADVIDTQNQRYRLEDNIRILRSGDKN